MKSLTFILLGLIAYLSSLQAFGQREDKITFNEGVDSYVEGNYADAQSRFEKAYERNNKNTRALYNAGNAAYLKGDFDKAKEHFKNYISLAKSPVEIAKAYFNEGNTYLQQADKMSIDPQKLQDAQELYKNAVNSFKNSLKHNPSDPEAKYNLTYALNKIQQNQQQQQQNQDKQNQENNENNKEQQENNNNENSQENNNNENSQENNNSENDQEKESDNDSDQEKNGDQKEDQKGNKGDQEDRENGQESDNQSDQGKSEEELEQEQQAKIGRAQIEKDLEDINKDEGEILKKVYGSKSDKKGTVNSGKDW